MNVWVNIARGCAGKLQEWSTLRSRLIEAVESRHLIVPLSPAHYLELWHRRNSESRRGVAEVMRDISGYATLPAPHVVRQVEALKLVCSWADPTVRMPSANDLLGSGAAHAFGREDGRFRFVESVASTDGETPEGPAAEPPMGWERLRADPRWEWFQLYGMDEAIPADLGFDRAPEHRFGKKERERELAFRAWLESHPEGRGRLRDLVVTEEYVSIREYIQDACRENKIPAPAALRANNWGPESAAALHKLVRSVPSADTWSNLRYLKHRDLNLPWEQHDWTDLWALSVAIPYCDAVITEKRWAHLAAAGGLAGRYATSIGHGLAAVERELTRIQAAQ